MIGLLIAFAVVLVYIAIITIAKHMRGDQRPRGNDEPMVSLVLLQSAPREYSEGDVRERLERALGITIDPSDGGASAFVVGASSRGPISEHPGDDPWMFMVKAQGTILNVVAVPAPYFDDQEAVAAATIDMRLQGIARSHQAYVSVDLLACDGERAAAYGTIGKFLAQFVDETTLAVLCPAQERVVVVDDSIVATLAGDDPLSAFDASPHPPVISMSPDDPRLHAAAAEARRRWGEFARAFRAPSPTQESFTIKARFDQDNETEYMWVMVRQISDTDAIGELGNAPNALSGIKLGDPVRIPIAEVLDWMYLDGGEMVGGFTVQVLAEAAATQASAD